MTVDLRKPCTEVAVLAIGRGLVDAAVAWMARRHTFGVVDAAGRVMVCRVDCYAGDDAAIRRYVGEAEWARAVCLDLFADAWHAELADPAAAARGEACRAARCGRRRVDGAYGVHCDLFWKTCCGGEHAPDLAAWRRALADPPDEPPRIDGGDQVWPDGCVMGGGGDAAARAGEG